MSGVKSASRLKKKKRKFKACGHTLPNPPPGSVVDLTNDDGGKQSTPIEIIDESIHMSATSGLSPGFGKTTITSSSGGGAPAPVKFTKEQTEIIQMAKKPGLSKGEIIRVKAAAGTGKTTTLQQIVCALASLGHKKISYVTFNKSAANDAGKRFYNDPVIKTMRAECECKTTHSSAFTSWTRHSNSKLLNPDTDSDIDKVIEANLVKEIDEFLAPAMADRSTSKDALQTMRKQVTFFIRKQLFNEFMWKATDVASCFSDPNKTYYPAKKEHLEEGMFFKCRPSTAKAYGAKFEYSFYIDCAKKIWELLDLSNTDPASFTRQRFTFDSVLRNAQLARLELDCTALLVDESQDLTACQVDWFAIQASRYKKQVFFVGDTNQAIYGFRGAKPTNMMNLEARHTAPPQAACIIDCSLTHSFRFDQNMACAANTILFVKDQSPQPNAGYRVTGAGKNHGLIVRNELVLGEGVSRFTVLANGNLTLFLYALTLLVKPPASQASKPSSQESGDGGSEVPIVFRSLEDIPKIAIMGKGEGSGRGKWRRIFKDIEYFSNLYRGFFTGANGSKFTKQYPEFYGEVIDFENIAKIVEKRELANYTNTIALVKRLKQRTMEIVGTFQTNVYEQNINEEDADIILSTVHAAKGCEWDNVLILDDLCPLEGSFHDPQNRRVCFFPKDLQKQKFQKKKDSAWQEKKDNIREWGFDTAAYGDHLNLWYVAVTRAKKVMAVPQNYITLYDKLLNWPLSEEECALLKATRDAEAEMSQKSGSSGDSGGKSKVKGGCGSAYDTDHKLQREIAHSLCVPWREKEMKFGGTNGCNIYEDVETGTKDAAIKAQTATLKTTTTTTTTTTTIEVEKENEVNVKTEKGEGRKAGKAGKTKKKKPGYYAVSEGRETGVFTSWEECEKQVRGHKDCKHQSFATEEDAEAWLAKEWGMDED